MELTPEQLRLVVVVYVSALLPLALVPALRARGAVPRWVPRVYAATFAICAIPFVGMMPRRFASVGFSTVPDT